MGHGLFAIGVVTGLNGADEMLAVKMFGGGDDDGVHVFLILEQFAPIAVLGDFVG